ncbi:MAG: hypothetical protein ACI9JY_002564, partial [Saprospiraceae bacterium]
YKNRFYSLTSTPALPQAAQTIFFETRKSYDFLAPQIQEKLLSCFKIRNKFDNPILKSSFFNKAESQPQHSVPLGNKYNPTFQSHSVATLLKSRFIT